MTKLERKDMDIRYIEWVDSRGGHEHWTRLDEIKDGGTICPMMTVGFVLQETEELIHILPHIGLDPEQGCGDMVIPKICIRGMVELVDTGGLNPSAGDPRAGSSPAAPTKRRKPK